MYNLPSVQTLHSQLSAVVEIIKNLSAQNVKKLKHNDGYITLKERQNGIAVNSISHMFYVDFYHNNDDDIADGNQANRYFKDCEGYFYYHPELHDLSFIGNQIDVLNIIKIPDIEDYYNGLNFQYSTLLESYQCEILELVMILKKHKSPAIAVALCYLPTIIHNLQNSKIVQGEY